MTKFGKQGIDWMKNNKITGARTGPAAHSEVK